jgi:hypothetical protein
MTSLLPPLLALDITLTAGSERRNGSPLGDRRRASPRREKFEARIARVRFEPLRQFLIAFRNFMHFPLVFWIAEVVGHDQHFFTAFSQFTGRNRNLPASDMGGRD